MNVIQNHCFLDDLGKLERSLASPLELKVKMFHIPLRSGASRAEDGERMEKKDKDRKLNPWGALSPHAKYKEPGREEDGARGRSPVL